MAFDEDSGRISEFNYSDKELAEKIETYKIKAETGEILLPSWPDFCNFLGVGNDKLEEVMDRGFEKKGAYYDRAVMLKKMGVWCEAQLVSNPNWGGKMAVKSFLLLKQGFGRSTKYIDERSANAKASVTAKFAFGGDDPRAKKAGK